MAAAEGGTRTAPQAHNLVSRLHHGTEEGSTKRRVGEFLESTKVEILILALVCFDLLLVSVEHGIDRHMICIEGNVAPLAPHPLMDLAEAHAEEHGSFLQALPGPLGVYGLAPHADFLSVSDVAPLQGSRRASRAGSLQLDVPTDDLVAESGLLSPLALLQGASENVQRATNSTAVNNHPDHGHEEHGHEEHGHEEHGEHEEHGHGAHGHHHVNEALVCETRDGPNAHHISHICHQLSITVLVIFLVEILAKIWVNAKAFFSNPFEVLDLVVVVLSLIVDVIILPMLHDPNQKHDAESVVILLMVCRLWRVVRIFHGLFEVVHHQMEEVEKLHEKIKELEEEIAERRGEVKPETKV